MKQFLAARKAMRLWLIMPLFAVASPCLGQDKAEQENASLVRDTELKRKPFSDAPTITTLPQALDILVLSRQSSWLQIRAEDYTGWVKMFSVRFTGYAAQTSDSFAGTKELFNLITTGSSGSTVTTASRGLDENKFSDPAPNPDAFAVMQSLTTSKTEAHSFAKEQNLREQQQDYLQVSTPGSGDKS
ncbi:hypothetical protein [Shewanella atlantica]|nr:hypothetical protein [Shewanella atlantica]